MSNFVNNANATALMGAVEQSIANTRVFKGTLDEWDALTAAEKAKYSYIATPDEAIADVANVVANGDMRPVTSNAVYNKFAVLEGTLSESVTAVPFSYPAGFNVDNCVPISVLWEETNGTKRDYWYGPDVAVNVQLYTQYVYATPRNSAVYGKKVWITLMKF